MVFFETWDDEKATGTLRTAEQAAGTCTLTWVEATLIGTGSGVELSTRTDQEQTTGVDLQDCLNQQDAWSGDRTCVRLDVVTGIRL